MGVAEDAGTPPAHPIQPHESPSVSCPQRDTENVLAVCGGDEAPSTKKHRNEAARRRRQFPQARPSGGSGTATKKEGRAQG